MNYMGNITLEILDKAKQSMTAEENVDIDDKIRTILCIYGFKDSAHSIIAKEFMKIGYLAAKCTKVPGNEF